MRNIEFCGKSKYFDDWKYGNLVQRIDKLDVKTYIQDFSGNPAFEVIPSTVREFTGLLDMHGEKIFEGHILKFYAPYGNGTSNCNVYWQQGNWRAGKSDLGRICHTCQIIGNIYDTPDLVNEINS